MKEKIFATSILKQPVYGYYNEDGSIKKPGFSEILKQLGSTMNPLGNQRKKIVFSMFFFYLITAGCFLTYLVNYLSISSMVYYFIIAMVSAHVYNTIWFHRYCSHSAFKFKDLIYTKLFLYTDTLFFCDINYALPHLAHHARPDKAEDPYGPHLGWLSSFLGPYINTEIDTNVSEKDFDRMKKHISHINLKTNSYGEFKQHGVMEGLWFFLFRKIIAQLLWATLSYLIGGMAFVFAYFSGVFIATTLILDFNWRGHGGNFRFKNREGWEFDKRSRALNQVFYALVGSEWHDNHHNFPRSANNAFLENQFDFAFGIIRLMKYSGIVSQYNDSSKTFYTKEFEQVKAA